MKTRTPPRKNECGHEEKRHYAKGMCASCYIKASRKDENKTVNVTAGAGLNLKEPDVQKHVAGAVVAKQMDVKAAVAAIAPDLTPAQVAVEAQKINVNADIQTLIEDELKFRGLDQASKDGFVEEMWRWLYHGNKELKVAAARILGRGFIADKVDSNKPQELVIRNYNEGISHMFGTDKEKEEDADTETRTQ